MTYPSRPIAAHNSWLVRPLDRKGALAGVMLHSTRSGVSDGDDGIRTENWWSNPSNKVADSSPWGSYADILIYEDGTQVLCTDWEKEYATWTAGYGNAGTWAAGIHYVQIEIAQGQLHDPFTHIQIASLADIVARLSVSIGFPPVRIPFLDQVGIPPRGICTHESSANGIKSGKTDPGPKFPWNDFLSMVEAHRRGFGDKEKIALLDALLKHSLATLEQIRLAAANELVKYRS